MTEAVKLRARLKEIAAEGQPVPTFNDMVVKACARALRDFPRANGAYRDGHVELYSRVNVGVAVAAQDALVVPTIFDADKKSLGEIAARSRELAAEGARRTDHAARALGRHVHGLQPRHVRHLQLLGRDQPAAGGAAGRRRARAEGGRRPRHAPRRGARHDGRARSPATTASCTARTARSSSGACATCSSSRSRSRCEQRPWRSGVAFGRTAALPSSSR